MYQGIPYRVIVTTSKGVNIILSNCLLEHERTYSHFMSAEDGAFFADKLRMLMELPARSTLDYCAICGKAFLKKDKVYRLKNESFLHRSCFLAEERRKRLDFEDLEERFISPFLCDETEFEFSNLRELDGGFLFGVQIVSETVIHIFCKERHGRTNHFVLTMRECVDLAAEIARQLERIKEAHIGDCFHCNGKIYIDQERYEMESGELVHARCMDKFVQSAQSTKVSLPARKIHLLDVFSHARHFPDMYTTPAFLLE